MFVREMKLYYYDQYITILSSLMHYYYKSIGILFNIFALFEAPNLVDSFLDGSTYLLIYMDG